MSPEDAYSLLESIAKISGTEDRLKKMKPEGHEIQDEETAAEVAKEAKRGPFRFSAVNIPVGSTIQYINDDKTDNLIKAGIVHLWFVILHPFSPSILWHLNGNYGVQPDFLLCRIRQN